MKKINTITKSKLEKYFALTEKALAIAEKSISSNKEKQKQSKEILEMVHNYLKDAKYFKTKNNFVNAFAAINYAHGWLDTGARLGIFNVRDNGLFVIK